MVRIAEAFVQIDADAKKFHDEMAAIRKELEALDDKTINLRLTADGVFSELEKIRTELDSLSDRQVTVGITPIVTKQDLQAEFDKFKENPPRVRVFAEVLSSQLQAALNDASPAATPLVVAVAPVFTFSGIQRALRKVTPATKRPKVTVDAEFTKKQVASAFSAIGAAGEEVLVHAKFSRVQVAAALQKAAKPNLVIDVDARIKPKGVKKAASAAGKAAADSFNQSFAENLQLGVGFGEFFGPAFRDAVKQTRDFNHVAGEGFSLVRGIDLTFFQMIQRVANINALIIESAKTYLQNLKALESGITIEDGITKAKQDQLGISKEIVLVSRNIFGVTEAQLNVDEERNLELKKQSILIRQALKDEKAAETVAAKAFLAQQRAFADAEAARAARTAASLAGFRAQQVEILKLTKGAASFNGVLGQTLSRAFNLGKIKFDNFNQLFGNALAADTLLNVLGNIFDAASRVRRVAVQMGANLAIAFAVGAQAAGALLSGLGRAASALEALAGIGVIAVGIKLLLNQEDVKAAKDNLVSTFKEVGTRAAEPLREPLKNFFNDLSGTVRNLEPTFNKFFKTVQPGFEKLGKSINDTLNSPQFQEFFDRIGKSANKFLEGFADRLPKILDGFLAITAQLKVAGAEIRKAFGPGIFDGISAAGIVQGIRNITEALVAAGPGVRAFKTAFGQAFDALKTSLKGILQTIGEVGHALFGALGPIAAQAVTSAGQIADAFIRLSAEVFPAVQANAQEFISTFGANFAESIRLLAGPLSDVANAALELGTNLAPLLPILSQILINLDPIATGFLNLLNTLTPLALAIASFAENFAQGFGESFGGFLSTLSAVASVISTVLTPAINLLSGPLGAIAGGILGIIAPAVLLGVTFSKVAAAATLAGGKITAAAAGTGATASALRILNTGWTTSAEASKKAATSYSDAARNALRSANAIQGTGAAARTSAAGFRASAAGLQAFSNANRLAATTSRATAVGMRLQGAAMVTVGAGARVAGTAMRGVGAAFRFALGPIGLIIIGIEVLIAAFKGLVTIGGGVIDIIKGNFSEGFKKIGEGAKEAAKGIKDHFLGTGDEVEGTLNDELAGVDPNTEVLVGKFAGIKVDIASAMEGTGPLVSEQLKSEFGKLDIAEKIKGLESLKEAGKAFTDTIIDNIPKRNATANILEGLGLDELAAKLRETGLIGMDELTSAINSKIPELQAELAKGAVDAGTARQILDSMNNLGVQMPPELLKGLQSAAGGIGPGISKTLSDAVPETIPIEQQKQNAIAEGFAKTVEGAIGSADIKAAVLRSFSGAFNSEQVSRSLGQQINGALALAFSFVQNNPGLGGGTTAVQNAILATFDNAFKTMPNESLGGKFANMMATAFKFAIAAGGPVSQQITETMSLAFDQAFVTLPAVLGQKISFMMGAAFATSIGTNTAVLGPQITETMSLAFDAAFALLPGVLGPKLSNMFTTLFSTVVIDGLSLSLSFQRVFTGALGLAFISLPAVIGPKLSDALNQGANQALSTFGTGLQTSINQAFTTAFSGVGEAINGPLSAAFLGATGAAATFATTIGGSMQTAADNITSAIDPLRTSIPQPFSDGFGEAIRVTQLQLDNLVSSVKLAKSNIEAIDFYGAGYQIGARLAAGIRASTADLVVPAADAMAAAVKDRTPNSPAKKGPLSGPGDPLRTGANIVKRLVAGMQEQHPQLVKEITKLVNEFHNNAGGINLADILNGLNVRAGVGGSRLGLGSAGSLNGGSIQGAFNKKIGGHILKQDTDAQIKTGKASNVLQIRPGQVNIMVPGTNDPREWINDMSRELMTNCIGR